MHKTSAKLNPKNRKEIIFSLIKISEAQKFRTYDENQTHDLRAFMIDCSNQKTCMYEFIVKKQQFFHYYYHWHATKRFYSK